MVFRTPANKTPPPGREAFPATCEALEPRLMLDSTGLYDPDTGSFVFRNTNTSGEPDQQQTVPNVQSTWLPLAGDWDGDGTDTIGHYDPATSSFYLRNSNTSSTPSYTFAYQPVEGQMTWQPLAGDWDGDGTDTVGLWSSSTGTWYLHDSHTSAMPQTGFQYGPTGGDWVPIVGDWNGDCVDTIGVYSPSAGTWYLRNSNSPGSEDHSLTFQGATSGWQPMTGDWNNDGFDTVGVYNPGLQEIWLRNSNTSGSSDVQFNYSSLPSGAWSYPLAGNWGSTPPPVTNQVTLGGGAGTPTSVRYSDTDGTQVQIGVLGDPRNFTATVTYTTSSQTSTEGGVTYVWDPANVASVDIAGNVGVGLYISTAKPAGSATADNRTTVGGVHVGGQATLSSLLAPTTDFTGAQFSGVSGSYGLYVEGNARKVQVGNLGQDANVHLGGEGKTYFSCGTVNAQSIYAPSTDFSGLYVNSWDTSGASLTGNSFQVIRSNGNWAPNTTATYGIHVANVYGGDIMGSWNCPYGGIYQMGSYGYYSYSTGTQGGWTCTVQGGNIYSPSITTGSSAYGYGLGSVYLRGGTFGTETNPVTVQTSGYWGRTVVQPLSYYPSSSHGYPSYTSTGLYCNSTVGGGMGPVYVQGGNVGGTYQARYFSGFTVYGIPLRSSGSYIYDVRGGGFSSSVYATNGGIGPTYVYGGNTSATYQATGRIGPVTQQAIVSNAGLYWYRDSQTGQWRWSNSPGAVYGGSMSVQYPSLTNYNQWYGSVRGYGANVTINGTSTITPPAVNQIGSSTSLRYISDYTPCSTTGRPVAQYSTTGGTVTGSITQGP